MPTRAFSIEDGNLEKQSITVARTRQDKDIDLSINARFIEIESYVSNIRGDIFKK